MQNCASRCENFCLFVGLSIELGPTIQNYSSTAHSVYQSGGSLKRKESKRTLILWTAIRLEKMHNQQNQNHEQNENMRHHPQQQCLS